MLGATGRYDIVRIATATRPKDAMPAARPTTSTQSTPLTRRMSPIHRAIVCASPCGRIEAHVNQSEMTAMPWSPMENAHARTNHVGIVKSPTDAFHAE